MKKSVLRRSLMVATALAALTLPAMAQAPIKSYTPVTQERLSNPEPQNWLMYRRTYDGQGFSPLKQITAANVKDLGPVWTFSTGLIECS